MVIDDFSPPARIRSCVGLLVGRPVRRGLQILLAETGLAEDAADGVDVERLTGVGGADQGEQVRGQIEPGPDQADRLQRLAGAAGIHRRQHRAQRADQLTVRTGDRHPTVVDALDRAVAHDLDQDRVTLERSLLGARLGCGGEIGHAVGGYSPASLHRDHVVRGARCRSRELTGGRGRADRSPGRPGSPGPRRWRARRPRRGRRPADRGPGRRCA